MHAAEIATFGLSRAKGRQQAIRTEIQALIREGIKDGSIRPCNDLLVANMLFGSFNHLTKWWSAKGSMPLESVASTYLDTLAIGIGAVHSGRSKS